MLLAYFVKSAVCIKYIAFAEGSRGNTILQSLWKVKNVGDLYSLSANVCE